MWGVRLGSWFRFGVLAESITSMVSTKAHFESQRNCFETAND